MDNNVKGHRFMDASGEGAAWIEKLPPATEDINVEYLRLLFRLIFERQEIWYKRFVLKQPSPWTDDPILRNYKFTNAYRELDRASQFVIENIFSQNDISIIDLIWRIIIFRFFNQPDTFKHSKYAVDLPSYKEFDSDKMLEQVITYREKVDNPFHTAFLMNIAFVKKPKDWSGRGLFKDWAYVKIVFEAVHKAVPKIAIALKKAKTPRDICQELEKLPAVSGFTSHEFYIDFCYAARYWVKPIMQFTENDYTNVGPGASLGLRLIFPSMRPKEQLEGIFLLKSLAKDMLLELGDFKYIHWNRQLQKYTVAMVGDYSVTNIEFYLCEMSKYFKMQIGEGKQRSKFVVKTIA